MTRFVRGLFILWVVLRHGLDELVLSSFSHPWLQRLTRLSRLGRKLEQPRGERLRLALESLGPIFVKFGQVLSTRRDLLPPDIADELARLQDRVPPFSSEVAVATIERAFGRPVDQVFAQFDRTPVASASIAQVHFAVLSTGREVAVKVLRPNMLPVIEKDLGLMRVMAGWVERLSADGRRLKPREVVAEFDKYLHDELDLLREASSAAQLRRNMQDLNLVLIPEMVWDYCHADVMVMQRMTGVPISQIERLRAAGVDIKKLARPRRRDPVFHSGVSRWLFPRRHAPGEHTGQSGTGNVWSLHFAGFRDRRHAHRVRQRVLGAEFHGILPA